jgi:class 3 adenylate cyclase
MCNRTEAAERSGLDPELVDQVWAASGMWDQPNAYEEDLEALRMVATAVKFGLPTEALLQSLRVFADSLGKVSEAATRLFHLHVHEQLRAQGLRGGELMAATQAVADPLADLVEPAILYFHRKSWERANREDLILHLQEESTAPGEFVRTLLFVDVSGYTAMTENVGDDAVARMLDRFSGRVRQTTAGCNGEVVKQIGDEFMLVFPDAPSAIEFGSMIQAPVPNDRALPPLRIGAHHGPVLYREGDYYGATVNLAARTTSVADGGQFVVTDALRQQLDAETRARLSPLGSYAVKGISELVELFEVSPEMESR